MQATVIGIVTVLLSAMLRKSSRELGILLTLAACVLIGLLLIQLAEPVVEFLAKLRNIAGLDKTLTEPILKTIGIGLITQIGATVCADAGENAIAKMIEVCGGILALYVSLPLLEAVLSLIDTMSGG
ncbi:MAG: stage III sporulation protein AD [Oscillospiraceae bacterium]|nr:stage III sporulation protein AD [Oscillospiraceae bacterium]